MMTVAIKFAYIVLICLINESMEITIRRGKNIVYQSKSEHLTSNVNSKHRDWVNEIKEEIKLSNLASPRKEGELDTPKGPPKKLLIFGSSETNGEICQRRIELVASKMYDEKVECRETVLTECVQGYTTKYEPTKVRQCTEDFKKNCRINYIPTSVEQEVKICEERYKRECDPSGKRGEEICVTVPSTVCISSVDSESSQEEIKCTQESKKICGPDTCALLKEEVCVTEVKDVIQDVPRETCRIEPTQTCRNVTKLVPNLHSKEDCLDIPKEICETLKINLRTVEKPVANLICRESKGGWGSFGEWSECVGTCGEGIQFRERVCETGKCKGFDKESRKCDTGIKCEEKDTTADSFLTETLEVTIPLSTGSGDSPTNDSPTDDSPTNDSPTDESPTGNSPNTDTDTSIVISGDDTLSLRGSTSNKTDDSDGLSSQVTIEPQDAFDCARNRIRFISSDHIKNIALPPNGEMRDKVRLCQILCVQKDGCQFYNIHVSAAQSSCTLFRAISDVVEEAEGYVGGIRHCLEEPVPVNDDEIIEDAS